MKIRRRDMSSTRATVTRSVSMSFINGLIVVSPKSYILGTFCFGPILDGKIGTNQNLSFLEFYFFNQKLALMPKHTFKYCSGHSNPSIIY